MDCEGAVKPNIFEPLPVLALFVFLVVQFGFVFVGELRTNLAQTWCPMQTLAQILDRWKN